jgi:hypothetical protein
MTSDRRRATAQTRRPGFLQRGHVACVDLLQRRVAVRAEIAIDCSPIAVGHYVLGASGLLRHHARRDDDDAGQRQSHESFHSISTRHV